MLEGTSLDIARFLASKARAGERTTYKQAAAAIAWGNPNGRGLGNYLGCVEIGGNPVGKISVDGGVRRILLDQLELVPATRQRPIGFRRDGRLAWR